jgi:hypothetical protein
MDIESPLFEEIPVTDIDLYLPSGVMTPLTLHDSIDSYTLSPDSLIISWGSGEIQVMFYAQLSGYSIRRRIQKRKIVKPVTVPQDAASLQSGHPLDEASPESPTVRPSSGS